MASARSTTGKRGAPPPPPRSMPGSDCDLNERKLPEGLMICSLQSTQAPLCFPRSVWGESGSLAAVSLAICVAFILSSRGFDIGVLTRSSEKIGWPSCGTQKGTSINSQPQGGSLVLGGTTAWAVCPPDSQRKGHLLISYYGVPGEFYMFGFSRDY